MKNLLKSGQILGRDELKKIMAGSGCYSECARIGQVCVSAARGVMLLSPAGQTMEEVCIQQFINCSKQCQLY